MNQETIAHIQEKLGEFGRVGKRVLREEGWPEDQIDRAVAGFRERHKRRLPPTTDTHESSRVEFALALLSAIEGARIAAADKERGSYELLGRGMLVFDRYIWLWPMLPEIRQQLLGWINKGPASKRRKKHASTCAVKKLLEADSDRTVKEIDQLLQKRVKIRGYDYEWNRNKKKIHFKRDGEKWQGWIKRESLKNVRTNAKKLIEEEKERRRERRTIGPLPVNIPDF
jgi:hypothetical protein